VLSEVAGQYQITEIRSAYGVKLAMLQRQQYADLGHLDFKIRFGSDSSDKPDCELDVSDFRSYDKS
jgi:hypothetical protein